MKSELFSSPHPVTLESCEGQIPYLKWGRGSHRNLPKRNETMSLEKYLYANVYSSIMWKSKSGNNTDVGQLGDRTTKCSILIELNAI